MCIHLTLYVAHETFLRCAALGTSLIMFVYGDLGPELHIILGQLNFYGVYNSWNIMYGLCMHAFEVVGIPLNLYRLCRSYHIS